MGVYNPNAIMPNNCAVCNEECKYRNITAHKRHKRCPLVEIETPHGRLIDADKLFGWYDGQREKYPVKKETPQYGTLMMYEIFDEIDDAPTVIETEPNEDCRTCKNYNTEKCNMCGIEEDYYEVEVE